MSVYPVLKHLHVTLVVLSVGGFVLRGVWALLARDPLRSRRARRVPHVIDTLLLLSAIALMLWLHQYPLVHAWLTAKVVAVIAYIGCGAMALRARSVGTRALALSSALLLVGYIYATVRTHDPLGFLRYF